ncbi:MAG TPA: trypsin-like peptidase domain-containing protein [Patescibacteria group bacterium]|nr:trypsin-like peptidase domain-containing protein [Patescibacteria group bacterium]
MKHFPRSTTKARSEKQTTRTKRILLLTLRLVGSIPLCVVVLGLLSFGLFFVISVLTSNNIFLDNDYDHMAVSQLLGWMAIFDIVIGLVIWRLMRRFKQRFWRLSRWIFFGLVLIAFTGESVGAGFEYHNGVTAPEASCDYNHTFSTAAAAIYPIAADNSGGGTAFAIDDHGTLLTAYHVIAGAKKLSVNWSQGSVPVTVIKTNKKYDLALLHYDQPTPDFLPLATDYDVTDTVYALGWPENTFDTGSPSITQGIISRIISGEDAHATDSTIPKDMGFIQTDAALNPGNSGGALMNACGAVGVVDSISTSLSENNAQTRDEGIAYAISAETIKKVFGL